MGGAVSAPKHYVSKKPRVLVRAKNDPPAMYDGPCPEGSLTFIHFNDVYNVEGAGKKKGGAARFVAAVTRCRAEALDRGEADPLCLFSGDCFNPSIMSTVVRGEQMPLVLNAAGVMAGCLGNHDFDHGPERLGELIAMCRFPWLLSNATLKCSGDVGGGEYTMAAGAGGGGGVPLARGARPYTIVERGGRKIGLIGLIEEEWLLTLVGLRRDDIEFEDFRVAGARLARLLRAPPHSVDLVVALTHMRQPNDEALAHACGPHSHRDRGGDGDGGWIDLILAGHDHHYGVTENNGCKIFKSGTDFEVLSTVTVSFPARAPATGGSGRDRNAPHGKTTVSVAVASVGIVAPGGGGAPSSPEGCVAGGGRFPGGNGAPQSPLEAALDAGREGEDGSQPPGCAYVSAHARIDVTPAEFGDGDDALATALAPFESRVNAMLGAQLCVSAVMLDSRRETIRLGEVRRR